jgi:predicted enzyme related to lactoylglutathione lyase
MKLQFNFFCHDIEGQLRFYQRLLDLPEAEHTRSPIFRSVHTATFQFGFHSHRAYALLGLQDLVPVGTPPFAVSGYPTFILASPAAVDACAASVASHGGHVQQGPFPTYYGQWQAVLRDPEENVFRVASESLPVGISAPTIEF